MKLPLYVQRFTKQIVSEFPSLKQRGKRKEEKGQTNARSTKIDEPVVDLVERETRRHLESPLRESRFTHDTCGIFDP